MRSEKKIIKPGYSFSIILCTCFVSAIGALIFNLLPLLINSAKLTFAFSDQQLGLMGSFFLAGFTLVTFSAVFWIQRTNWRYMGLAGLLTLVCSMLLMSSVSQLQWLYLLLTTSGLGASVLFCLAMAILAEAPDPASAFGIKAAVEMGVASGLLYLLPRLLTDLPFGRVMVAAALVAIVLGLLVFKMPVRSCRQPVAEHPHKGGRGSRLTWLGLLGMLFYFAGQTAEWTFLGRMGQAEGFDQVLVGKVLSFVKFLGAVGALTAGLLGDRFGRFLPFVFGFILFFVSVSLLLNSGTLFNYITGGALFEFSWGLLLAYMMGLIATSDSSGRLVVLIPSTLAIGGAFGPGFAGYLITGDSFAPVIWFTTVTALAGMVIFLWILRSLQQQNLATIVAPNLKPCVVRVE